MYSEILIPANATTNIQFGTIGLNVNYQLNKQFVLVSEMAMILGKQETSYLIQTVSKTYVNNFYSPYVIINYKLHEEHESNTIMGIQLQEHFLFYPNKAKGLVLGSSICFRALNAKFYKADLGLAIHIGLKR